MDNRIFHIDRDCYLIFAEELSSRKERFLRIGASDYPEIYGEKLSFAELATPLLPSSVNAHLKQFNESSQSKIMGLKSSVNDLTLILKANNKNIDNLTLVYADTGSSPKAQSEKDFIDDIEYDEVKARHTFASFYSDGNIRIFNRDGIFFDLQSESQKRFSILDEINNIYTKNSLRYNYNDKKGFIISGESLFIFAENTYHCITASGDWVLDAAVSGINPLNIESICMLKGAIPGAGSYEIFYERWKSGKKIKAASSQMPPNRMIYHTNPLVRTFLCSSKSLEIQFQNDRIRASVGSLKLFIKDTSDAFNNGKSLDYIIRSDSEKIKGSFILEEYSKGKYTLYKYHPLLSDEEWIENSVSRNISIFDSVPEHIKALIRNDSDYGKKFIVPMENRDSLKMSITGESIRRLAGEGSHSGRDIVECYASLLKGVNGLYFRNNSVTMYQCLFVNNKNPVVKNIFSAGDIERYTEINDCFFMTSSMENIQNYHDIFDSIREYNISQKKLSYRFDQKHIDMIIEKNEFYLSERKRLKHFIEELEVLDMKMEEHGFPYDAPYSTLNTAVSDKIYEKSEPSMIGSGINAGELFLDIENEKKKIKLKKILLSAASLIFILLLLFFIIPQTGRFFKSDMFKSIITGREDAEAKKIKKQSNAVKEIKLIESAAERPKKTVYYSFFMTHRDRIAITNKIALLNGYRRMLLPFEVKYSAGRNPDWIYPGNVLLMPDNSMVVVKEGDVMWRICEKFLYEQMNNDEKKIIETIDRTARNQISVEEAKGIFTEIINSSDSEMIRAFSSLILLQEDFSDWKFLDREMQK